MNEGLACRRDPGRLEAPTQLLAGLRAIVGHRLGDELHAAHRLAGIDAFLSEPALAPDLRAWGCKLVEPPVVLAAHEVERGSVKPGDNEGATPAKGTVHVGGAETARADTYRQPGTACVLGLDG
ncbi:MAG TPA: hypothetical protein VII76_13265 [Acidimicrobiales bacterium]